MDTAEEPSGTTPGKEDRDPRGRFVAGNKAARGNPHAKKVGQLRSALLRAVTTKRLRNVVEALIAKAESGDVAAARELFDRTLGKPTEADLIERMTELEEAIKVICDARTQRPT